MHPIARKLISWYAVNGRDLPWRKTKDPYRIWLSEIILQQTRVDQGLPYYLRFEEEFPDVRALAEADEQHVLKLWQGLGYYSRARNLHKAAKIVLEQYGGRFPNDHEGIRSLPGVGDYTAAAVASFAFRLPHAVVDGNVYRFLSRLFGITLPIDSSEGRRRFQTVAQELIKDAPPDDFNQSLMEFGALYCTPSNPSCPTCIFSDQCIAARESTVSTLPVKSKKQKVRDRHFHYLVVMNQGDFYLKQRDEKDIWKNMWEFPMLESSTAADEQWVLEEAGALFDTSAASYRPSVNNLVHQLSHQRLYATFYEFILQKNTKLPGNWHRVDPEELDEYPLPRLIDRYIKERCSESSPHPHGR